MRKNLMAMFLFVMAVMLVFSGCTKKAPTTIVPATAEVPAEEVVADTALAEETAIAEAAPVVEATTVEGTVPIVYIISGIQKRVDASAVLMEEGGYSIHKEPGEEVMGEFKGNPWPGVQIRRQGAAEDAGIFVPVSNDAVANGLCEDQAALIGSLPVSLEVAEPVVAVAETVDGCDEKPFAVSGGFWAKLDDGIYVECKSKPGSYAHKVVRCVKEGRTVTPTCRLERSYNPDEPYTEVPAALLDPGETVEVVGQWDLPEGDGGLIKTYLIFQVKPAAVVAPSAEVTTPVAETKG